ncbi:MAG: tetratricopeptide repeat protein [candidate division NC10 bacterium]|jgi:Tfp pilus assembly protein PilF|nr:tetratricopeptide repeat protein [candidate division NC10 bacterium]MCH7895544.1 tetratricopeptide repeat protein [candidate division NC10 bacterium]
MTDPARLEQAEFFFQEGYKHQVSGDLDAAIEDYHRSIEFYPTAEAHTFLGWAYSFQGKIDEAIQECETAIEIDPDFGNPYNDIGVYMMERGEYDEAVPWLLRAMEATRYEPRHYPHINLGRLYARKGRVQDAIAEIRKALNFDTDHQGARRELHRLIGMLN